MIFWQSKRPQQLTKQELREQAIIRKSEHQSALESIYKSRAITLAIAKMSYRRNFNFYSDDRSKRKETSDLVMIGVVHEPYRGAKRVYCQIEFINQNPEYGFVGSCTLTHLGIDERRESYQRAMMLQVFVWDADARWRHAAYDCLQEAAVSQDRFCHFRISTELANVDEAAALMRERGYGPTLKLREFTLWPTIVLPNTPSWAWNREE